MSVCRRDICLKAGAIILLTLVVFLPAMRADFIWDDDAFLTHNPLIHAKDGLRRFWLSTEPPDYFPLTSSMLWFEWRIWGMNPVGYHVVNVILHAANAVLLWLVLRRLKIPGAWLAGLIFAVHPVNVESVAWVTERKNLLPLFFALMSLLLYLAHEDPVSKNGTCKRRWYLLSLVAFLLALLSKTSVVMLPFVLLGCAWWLHGRIKRRHLLQVVPFFLLAAMLSLVTIWFQYNRAITTILVRDDSFLSRLAGTGWAIWFYLYKAVLPVRLCFVYPRWQIDASSVLSYIPLFAIIAGVTILWRFRRQTRPVQFGLGYFVISLCPVLGFFNIYFMRYSLVADHWQYVALPGVIALCAGAGAHALRRKSRSNVNTPVLLGAAVVILLGVLSWQQTHVYQNQETLFRDTIRKNPSAWLAHSHLGNLFLTQGKLEEAHKHQREALRLAPQAPECHNNLANVLLAQGTPQAALVHYQKAVQLAPRVANMHFNLANALQLTGQRKEALMHYTEAVEIDPSNARTHNNMANTLLKLGHIDEAITHYREAARLAPTWAPPLIHLAELFAGAADPAHRNPRESMLLAERTYELEGTTNPEAVAALAAAHAANGDFSRAAELAAQALAMSSAPGHNSLRREIKDRLQNYQSKVQSSEQTVNPKPVPR